MSDRYDQSELNLYGAEDDDDLDAIYRAVDAWERGEAELARRSGEVLHERRT